MLFLNWESNVNVSNGAYNRKPLHLQVKLEFFNFLKGYGAKLADDGSVWRNVGKRQVLNN